MNTTHDLAQLLRERGARVTPARLRVLALLRGADRALSHHDIEERLVDGTPVDRVTLYRVLDWLVEQGLAHKLADEQRVFRFSAASKADLPHGSHAHFVCDDCGKVFCLEEVAAAAPRLPDGFASTQIDFSVHGHCAACNVSGAPK
ncbi:Fur family transcriptional regulator [Niveibacterium sp. SC-1]|uniref:Fur family transcriptional regulator n=1 Tax=Niveibacterium sp. SC-1 TaxID=3135646 RepID=UPI00312047C3